MIHVLGQTIFYCRKYRFSYDINFSCWSYIKHKLHFSYLNQLRMLVHIAFEYSWQHRVLYRMGLEQIFSSVLLLNHHRNFSHPRIERPVLFSSLEKKQ